MSLDVLLTPTRLRELAGYGFERGVRYFQQGRVRSCAVHGDELRGVVEGSMEYGVRVFAAGNTLAAQCACPISDRVDLCKHAVALALAHLERAPAPVSAPCASTAFATRRELEAWAEAHHVGHELAVSATVLVAELTPAYGHHGLDYVLGRLALRDLGSLEGAARYLGVRRLEAIAAKTVRARLVVAAAAVARALDRERAAPTPADPALRPVWQQLAVLRRELRAHAYPRDDVDGVLDLDASAGALVWKEPTRLVHHHATVAVVTRLTLSPRPSIACACGAAACTHALALVDRALALIADPAHAREAARIAEELLRPPWSRALAELARHDDAAPRPDVQIWWQLDDELGVIALVPVVKKPRKRGGLGAGARTSPQRLLADHGAELAEVDARVAELLTGGGGGTYPARALAALVGHPRVVHADEPDQPIEIRRVPLGFTAIAAGDEIRLEPAIDGARFSPRLLAALLDTFAPSEPLLVVERERARCLLVDVSDDARRLWSVLARHGDAFPPESHGALLERLARLEPRLPIDVPQALKGDRVAEQATVVVRLRLASHAGGARLELEAFVRPAAGAPLFPPGVGPRDVIVARPGGRAYVRRDLGTELERVRGALARLPLDTAVEAPPLCFQLDDTDAALAVVAAVQAAPTGLEAEWIDVRPTIVATPGAAALRVQIDRKRDWFGIAGELAVEHGRIELAVVLDAARRQQRYVRFGEHRWLELTAQLRAQLAGLADRTFAGKHQLELSPGAAPAIRALVDAGAEVETTPAWDELAARVAASARLRPRPPAGLTGTLRPYQIEGHAWLSRLAAWGAGGCLADDMGLGKTIQAIAVLIDRARLGPALVLAPTSVTLNWVDELRRFAPSLRPIVYADATDRAGCLAALGNKDVLIASYGLLAQNGALLATRRFATLVADEAQQLKNPTTRRARAARALAADFRLAMSGTPLENHLGELWSLFAIVFPGLLGSWEQFRARFATPIEKSGDADARAALARVIQPFLLRRTKHEVARELPARTEIDVPVVLSHDEQALYDDARLAAVAELSRKGKGLRDERRRFQVLAALTRLRLLASHPRLYDPKSPVASSKMARLLELVHELRDGGHRALVFSQFTSHLALVRGELARAGCSLLYLDGATPLRTRAQLIEQFQAGAADVFLISLKAGGTGINLTGADYVIHLDPWWNPAVEDQATDRAHRIGQTRPVTVYRLVARGTVEEQILAMHRDKRALVAGVLDGTDAAARLTTRELIALLG